MASQFYDKHLPDYGDLDNGTGKCPGFTFGVLENDGGVGLYMGLVDEDYDGTTFYRAFLNVGEAEKLKDALEEAIERAKGKALGVPHRDRVK
jgi:hypothetical protein